MPLEPVELDVPTADRLVAALTPGARVVALRRLGGGTLSSVFEATRADGGALVLKLYPTTLGWKLDKELFLYDLLRRLAPELPLADVLGSDATGSVVAQPVLALTKLAGAQVAQCSLTGDELLEVDRGIGVLLRKLHGVTLDAFGDVRGSGVAELSATNRELMERTFARHLDAFESLGGVAGLRTAIARHVRDHAHLFERCLAPSVCHGDCHHANVLVAHRDAGVRVTGLFDLENAVAGDPLFDLARTHCYRADRSERTLAALVEGYGGLPDAWHQAFDLYSLGHRLELWVFLAGIGQRERLPELAAELRSLVSR